MKKLTKVIMSGAAVAALGASMAFGFAACGGNTTTTITVNGSSSVTPVMEVLAAAYEEQHSDIRIDVNQTDSGAGVTAVIDGTADIGMASRALKDDEISQGVEGQTMCNDGIALVTGVGCTATNITTEEVKALYTELTPACDGVITGAVGRGAGSGTRSFFDEHFEISAYNSDVSTQQETGDVVSTLTGTTSILGYISYASLAPNANAVKAISLDGVECTIENIVSGDYKLQRPFVIVTSSETELSEAAQGFYDFLFSEEAQEIITAEGCISIR